MSLAACFVDILSKDVTDIAPSTVVSGNSSSGWTLLTVPEYTYKSLGTLWISPSTSPTTLAKRNSLGV